MLLAAMALQMVLALPHASAVVDEPAHLTAGYLALARHDLAVNREHPPLVKVLAALPLLAMRPVLPPLPEGASDPAVRATEDFEFHYSREFLFRANDADRLLAAARLPVVILTLGTGAILFLWGRALAGATAGLAALGLAAFESNLLAHGRLVTTDAAAALFCLAALACLERCQWARSRRRGWTVAAGFALGLALLSRYSSLLMLPLMAAALLLDRRRPPSHGLRALLVIVIVAVIVVNAGYCLAGIGLHASLFPLASAPVGGPLHSWPLSTMESHPVLRWTPLPLPRLYVEGLDLARFKNRFVEGPGYLDGEISSRGWWRYFIEALALKLTLPLLALAAAGLAWRGLRDRRLLAYVVVPAAGYLLLVTALTRAQIGLRYVLPVVPLVCLLAGTAAAGLAAAARRRRLAGVALVALLLWHAGAALWIFPYHLAYFNEAAGGPDNGYRHLVDSNLDWGQDLVGLGDFLRDEGTSRVNLYYFGTADPAYYGIERAVPPEPGWYAVSATHLVGVYLPDRAYLAPFLDLRPRRRIGHSIFLYRLDTVPEFLTKPIRRP